MSYPKLIPCSVCGKYPDLLKVQDEYKYVVQLPTPLGAGLSALY